MGGLDYDAPRRPRTATLKLCETSIGEEGGVVYGGGVLMSEKWSKHSYGMSPRHPLQCFSANVCHYYASFILSVWMMMMAIFCKIFLNSAFYLVLFI